jgi:hypothetical protein
MIRTGYLQASYCLSWPARYDVRNQEWWDGLNWVSQIDQYTFFVIIATIPNTKLQHNISGKK